MWGAATATALSLRCMWRKSQVKSVVEACWRKEAPKNSAFWYFALLKLKIVLELDVAVALLVCNVKWTNDSSLFYGCVCIAQFFLRIYCIGCIVFLLAPLLTASTPLHIRCILISGVTQCHYPYLFSAPNNHISIEIYTCSLLWKEKKMNHTTIVPDTLENSEKSGLRILAQTVPQP